MEIPEVALFVGPGRNLAVLVETAIRAYILRMCGFDPLDDFIKRHQEHMNNAGPRIHPGATRWRVKRCARRAAKLTE